MLIGGFDLSLGSMLALAGIALGAFINDFGIAVVPAILMTVALGAVLGGGINGALIGRAGMPFLVVTLGTLILYRGVVNLWSDAKTEQIASPALDALAFNSIAGVPVPVWIMVVTFLVALYVQRSTYFGRDVYAVGGGPEAARVSGIRVSRTIIAVYALAGALAAFGGVLQDARIGAASPMVGDGIIFDAAAAGAAGRDEPRGREWRRRRDRHRSPVPGDPAERSGRGGSRELLAGDHHRGDPDRGGCRGHRPTQRRSRRRTRAQECPCVRERPRPWSDVACHDR